jgi:hypothetical protein
MALKVVILITFNRRDDALLLARRWLGSDFEWLR